MNPSDLGRAFTEFWTGGIKVTLEAQDAATRSVSEGMRAMSTGPSPLASFPGADTAELTRANQAMADLWSAAAGMSATLASNVPGASNILGASNVPGVGASGAGDGGPAVDAVLRNMLDPRTWLAGAGGMDAMLGRAVDAPQLADLWSAERQYARVMHAWLDLRRRGLEHNAVVLEAWLRAGQAFSEEAAGRARVDGRALDSKALLALWTETANKILQEMQRSEAFLQTQAANIRANTALLLAQRDLVEHFGRQYGFPTRTELDDVHRTVTELRRGMRTMRRELRKGPSSDGPGRAAQSGPARANGSRVNGSPADRSPDHGVQGGGEQNVRSKVSGPQASGSQGDAPIIGTEISELQDGAEGPSSAPPPDTPTPDTPTPETPRPTSPPPPAARRDAAPRVSRPAPPEASRGKPHLGKPNPGKPKPGKPKPGKRS